MTFVAILALDLGVIRAVRDRPEEDILILILPTANILLAAGIVGLRRERARAFALGFVVVGALSLLAFHGWVQRNPWSFLRLVNPPIRAVEGLLEPVWPAAVMPVLYTTFLVAFAIPHAALGLAGGYLAARGWATLGRRGGGGPD